jgi:hypothetical protein
LREQQGVQGKVSFQENILDGHKKNPARNDGQAKAITEQHPPGCRERQKDEKKKGG